MSDPQNAAAWVSSFPAGNTRDSAISSIMSSWANSDPKTAADWLNSLPADKGQDRAAQNFVNQISWEYPDIAATLVSKISEETQRDFAIENVARQWLQIDRKSAEAWLNQTSLPDDRKARLLQRSH
jgi:hypothetical protein